MTAKRLPSWKSRTGLGVLSIPFAKTLVVLHLRLHYREAKLDQGSRDERILAKADNSQATLKVLSIFCYVCLGSVTNALAVTRPFSSYISSELLSLIPVEQGSIGRVLPYGKQVPQMENMYGPFSKPS
jgi:transketolase N-terminal domain/subunit